MNLLRLKSTKKLDLRGRISNHSTLFVLVLFFSISIMSFYACTKNDIKEQLEAPKVQQNEVVYQSVTEAEYAQASELTKRLIDQVDAAVTSIDILSKNNQKGQFQAILNFNKDPKNLLGNSVIIGLMEPYRGPLLATTGVDDDVESLGGSCHVCGLRTAYSCIEQVKKYMEDHNKNEIIATISRDADGCVDIKYH